MGKLQLAVLLLCVVPRYAWAQVCFGSPAPPGSGAIAVGVDLDSGAQSYVMDGAFYSRSAVIGTGHVAYAHYSGSNTSGYSVSGDLGYALGAAAAITFCPFAGAAYAQVAQPAFGDFAAVDQTILRAGIAGGAWLLRRPTSQVIIWVMPAVLYSRIGLRGVGAERQKSGALGGAFGLTFGSGKKTFGANIAASTLRNSHPVLGLRVGVLVGGQR